MPKTFQQSIIHFYKSLNVHPILIALWSQTAIHDTIPSAVKSHACLTECFSYEMLFINKSSDEKSSVSPIVPRLVVDDEFNARLVNRTSPTLIDCRIIQNGKSWVEKYALGKGF